MTRLRWETVSPSETRAEVEAVLESQGESERIRAFLNASPQITEWRDKVRDLCKEIIDETGIAALTPDILFEQVAPRAHEMIPQEVKAEVKARLEVFLQTQFEDHISK
jgi:enhancer of yellow 2 transcription factor